jgi:ferrochelatase
VSEYDAVIVVSFGGPEGPDEVMPFLGNVLRGRNVPKERMLRVAEHYYRFGGISPINEQNRALISAVETELADHGHNLPVYFGNRNWDPMLADTIATMRDDGVTRALAFVTSAYGSYSGCRQYRDDIEGARAEVGPDAPHVDKLRLFYNHPGFVAAIAAGLRAPLAAAGPAPLVLFSAHSIPTSMAAGSPYEEHLRTTASLVAAACGVEEWELVYQSRSGPPTQPWLGPDVLDRLRSFAAERSPAAVGPPDAHRSPGVDGPADADRFPGVVICPIGFVSDHMEVVYDLDTEAAELAGELDLRLFRAPTAGTHPAFVSMIRELVEERVDPALPRLALGPNPPWGDHCPLGCCPAPVRPPPA